MKALVTGATGFVGSHLVDALLQNGVEVTALARSAAKASALATLGVRVVPGDLHDREALERAARDQSVIYHVAGAVAAIGEPEFLRANRDGTRNVVLAAEAGGAGRFVFVSSLAAGGPSPRGLPLQGNEAPRPVTAYGRRKLEAERVVQASGLAWTIVRPPLVYGPRDREVLKVFRLIRFGISPVFGDGSQELSAVHAADLATALVAAGASASTSGRTYHACHPEVFTTADFGRAVATAMGCSATCVRIPRAAGRALLSITGAAARVSGRPTILTADKANEFFQPAWTGDPAPLIRDSGWRPNYDLRTGLDHTYQWYRKAGWL